jgi:hypothetical protein
MVNVKINVHVYGKIKRCRSEVSGYGLKLIFKDNF